MKQGERGYIIWSINRIYLHSRVVPSEYVIKGHMNRIGPSFLCRAHTKKKMRVDPKLTMRKWSIHYRSRPLKIMGREKLCGSEFFFSFRVLWPISYIACNWKYYKYIYSALSLYRYIAVKGGLFPPDFGRWTSFIFMHRAVNACN